jgi:hypothetical protein
MLSQMTNSQEVAAIQIPKMGDIVKVVKPEAGLDGLTGEVRDISEDGYIGVEFPGWGGGHRLENQILEEADGWYLAKDELEVLE